MNSTKYRSIMPLKPYLSVGLLLSILLTFQHLLASGIIVDGSKKESVSPVRNQESDEKSAIDSFNTRACGMADPNSNEHEFVNMAREGQFPWLVSFQIRVLPHANVSEQIKASARQLNDSSKTELEVGVRRGHRQQLDDLHFCSGSFISDKWILSAAHCFVGPAVENYLRNDKLKAVAGSHKVSSRSSLNRNLTIERIYVHSKFERARPVGFDIALVELRTKVNFSQRRETNEFGEQSAPYANGICLPLADKRYAANESTRIAGWGLSRAKDVHTMPSKLLTTDLLVRDSDECLKHYSRILNSSRPLEHERQFEDLICASYNNTRDACQSDSGGPLMQYANKKAIVIGIVSYGIGCATKGVPGLYTRTSAYIEWIKAVTTRGREAEVDMKVLESTGQKATSTRRPRKIEHEDASNQSAKADEDEEEDDEDDDKSSGEEDEDEEKDEDADNEDEANK